MSTTTAVTTTQLQGKVAGKGSPNDKPGTEDVVIKQLFYNILNVQARLHAGK